MRGRGELLALADRGVSPCGGKGRCEAPVGVRTEVVELPGKGSDSLDRCSTDPPT
jgi:hypothetical protein